MISEKHPEDAKIEIYTDRYCRLELDAPCVELDLGCGVGSFTSALARRFPERLILGADVMLGRLRKLVRRNDRLGLTNCRVLRVEARQLLTIMLPDRSLDRIHLLCPDPWPKERHQRHRLLTSDFTAQLHRVLKEDGIFHFSSDDVNYREAVKRILAASGLFEEISCPPDELPAVPTDFEQRWLEAGKDVLHLYCRKLPLSFSGVGH